MTTTTTTGKNIAPDTLGTESAPAQLVPSLEDAADDAEAASKEPISARTWFIIVLCAVAQYNLTVSRFDAIVRSVSSKLCAF